ncbi:LysR family transcriptional regulator substrate-binding protein [Limosilactobacillus avium]|uniref:LysR family transcriptional regulator substrate-binding protein n=1 Tax=Limosilactobacillus avium TaxID=2991831 RepID=UPI0024B9756B|nr:LysR family transcriptional regulator substrate-binding protein [Limosilactobacillus avium]
MSLWCAYDQTIANVTAEQIISGDITIGAGESTGIKYVNKVLTDIHGDYPDIKIHLISGNTSEMETALDQGRIDFAILVGNYPVTNYDYLQLPEKDHWGLVIQKEDALAQKANIKPEDLLNRQLIVPQQTIADHTFQKWWGNLGNQMTIMATYTLVYNARTLIQTNYSCLLSIGGLIDNAHDSKLVFRPLNPVMTEPLTIIWKKNTLLSKAAQLFKQRLSTTLK